MNCRESRFQVALYVGNDLDDSSAVAVQRHLATCDDCRDHHDRLSDVMQTVELAEEQSSPVIHRESVWPQLAAVIKVREQDRTRRFNGWVAGLAVAAMALAAVTISQSLPSNQSGFRMSEIAPVDDFGVPVSFPNEGSDANVPFEQGRFSPQEQDLQMQRWLNSLSSERQQLPLPIR